MCFNIGVIIGPILGGSLADPVHSFPSIFGSGSFIGGKDGVWWMEYWPYALPNVLSALFIFSSLLAVFFGLDEVSPSNLGAHAIKNTDPIIRRTKLVAIASTGVVE